MRERSRRPIAGSKGRLDVEFVPTPPPVLDKMLEVANLHDSDVVVDLGCGDGRLVIEAARRYGSRGVGVDHDPVRVAEACARAQAVGVGDRVEFRCCDIFEVELRGASVVMLYLSPTIHAHLVPQLRTLPDGARIIAHDFHIEGFDYDEVWTLIAPNHRPRPKEREHHIFKWTVPLLPG